MIPMGLLMKTVLLPDGTIIFLNGNIASFNRLSIILVAAVLNTKHLVRGGYLLCHVIEYCACCGGARACLQVFVSYFPKEFI
jgi:hypothetical protein